MPHPSHADPRVPLLDIAGTSFACGEQLGYAWQDTLRLDATRLPDASPWWHVPAWRRLLDRHAPHLIDLYLGMAKGAGLPEHRIGERAPPPADGCTSFAIQPAATLHGHPLSGQTKDTPVARRHQYQLLRLRPTDTPAAALTLTYPGWLFGHGFVAGGCAIFRNSLYAGPGGGRLPYLVWGLLALHCPTVDDVLALTRDHCPDLGFHATVADEHGAIAGLEIGRAGTAVLTPANGLYIHANAVIDNPALQRDEQDDAHFQRADSHHRVRRLTALLTPDLGRLTPQLVHRGLTVTLGHPCAHWPATYSL
jgi:hypothetical protein